MLTLRLQNLNEKYRDIKAELNSLAARTKLMPLWYNTLPQKDAGFQTQE
jgi:hypothetical protein